HGHWRGTGSRRTVSGSAGLGAGSRASLAIGYTDYRMSRLASPVIRNQVDEVLRSLEEHSSTRVREEMEPRYGIVAPKAFGTPMAKIKLVAKHLCKNHELAGALWETGWYEARRLTSFLVDPARVTPEQMDAWCSDFDNWAIVDTLCFNLFDRTPHAMAKVAEWARLDGEFERRAAFALLACLALHRKDLPDDLFLQRMPLI